MAALLRKPEYSWPLLWGSLAAVLVVVLVMEYFLGGSDAGKGPRLPAKVADAKLLPPFTLPPEAPAGSETVARPLFVPGRRPAPPAAAVDVVVMKKGQFLLQGTTVAGDVSFALLREVATGKIHRVPKGGRVLDMTLADVGPGTAVLTLGSDSETLVLLVAKGSGQPAPASGGPFAPSTGPGAAPAAAPQRQGAVVAPPGASPAAGVASTGSQAVAASMAGHETPGMTPEEVIARRRAARRGQAQN